MFILTYSKKYIYPPTAVKVMVTCQILAIKKTLADLLARDQT